MHDYFKEYIFSNNLISFKLSRIHIIIKTKKDTKAFLFIILNNYVLFGFFLEIFLIKRLYLKVNLIKLFTHINFKMMQQCAENSMQQKSSIYYIFYSKSKK